MFNIPDDLSNSMRTWKVSSLIEIFVCLGHKGFIQDRQEQPILCDMQSISITLQDKITGPFQVITQWGPGIYKYN